MAQQRKQKNCDVILKDIQINIVHFCFIHRVLEKNLDLRFGIKVSWQQSYHNVEAGGRVGSQ